jgi:dTDP-4-amino-4,6-dideoxygalactose transaminase
VGTGDELICEPFCIFAALAVLYQNAIPVFVDINPDIWNINPDLIESKITERTKALIVTHICGLPVEIDRIVDICHRHNLIVIEDVAHALLARYKGKYVGTWGDIGSFSFQMAKQMPLGDGGMAVTNNQELRDRLI